MRRYRQKKQWFRLALLALLALNLQACLGSGDTNNGNFQAKTTSQNGKQIGINADAQNSFKGRLYFVINDDLYTLDSKLNLKKLTQGLIVRDPAVSPDGKTVAFIRDDKDYSDLMLLPTSGGTLTTLISGNGKYKPNPFSEAPMSTHHWYTQPSWAPDSQHLLILSDLQKADWDPQIVHYDAFILDLQVFSIDINHPQPENMQAIAYADIGDGGIQNASYRPGHSDQVIYTNYSYDDSGTRQEIQLTMIDAHAVPHDTEKVKWRQLYHPGAYGTKKNPSVPITPAAADLANMQPAFSPDGNSILYIRRENASQMSLYSMPVPEGITSDPNNPAFKVEAQDNLDKALAPYNQSTKLITQQYISWPAWSPDSKQILYYGYYNQTFDIWIASVNKDPKTGTISIKPSSQIQLTNTQGELDAQSHPCWIA